VSRAAQWRGLVALIRDSVENASHAIERVHLETARRPFDALEQIPPVAIPAQGVRAIHDATVASVHGIIRLVTRAASGTVDAVLDVIERHEDEAPPAGSADPR
jgi:hypothetical protein